MTSGKRAFLSHSHADREFTERLAHALMAQGQDVWFDKWDIGPGDSVVTKIFEEGLAKASAFIVVLSRESVKSRWVREELNVATVRRIEDLTKLIPVLKEDAEIPTALRTLHWVDMRSSFDEGVRRIVNSLAGISDRPPLGELPMHLRDVVAPVSGLSRLATTAGRYLLEATDIDASFTKAVLNTELANALSLAPIEVNDAVDELESQGLAETGKEVGTHPYDFSYVEATYLLYHAFADHLPYDPATDVKTVLTALAALRQADGATLASKTSLSAGRLNRAVDYIKDRGLAEVLLAVGTAPYSFMLAEATRQTRQAALGG